MKQMGKDKDPRFERVSFRRSVLALAILGIAGVGHAAQVDYIQLKLEEPDSGSIATGISNLRGWAVGKFGVERVEYFLDDATEGKVIPYGGKRTDVGGQFTYPNDDYSGFSMALNYNLLEPGTHTITVRAWDRLNDHAEVTQSFEVVRFGDRPFLPEAEDAVSLEGASGFVSGNDVMVYNVNVDGNPYNMTLSWVEPKQRPDLSFIEPFDLTNMIAADGLWDVVSTTDGTACGDTSTSDLNASVNIAVSPQMLDMNGLPLYFSAVNQSTMGMKFTGTQQDSAGDIAWMVEIAGAGLSGTGVQQRNGCEVTYTLVGTKQ